MTVLVNLFAGPGSGKSTLAHGVMHELKKEGKSAEFAHEWIKHPVWQGRTDMPQYYTWAKQQKLIDGLWDKVDIIVTDSPTLLSVVYGADEPQSFRELVQEKARSAHALNVFVNRYKDYWTGGRTQTRDEAEMIDQQLYDMLRLNFAFVQTKDLENPPVDLARMALALV